MTPPPTVHVVDDDPGVRDSVALLLRMSGYTVETYESGTAFLERLEYARRGCVLLDIHMPGMTGLELQRELAARAPDLPVVMMTGQGDIGMAVQAMKAGASDFIEKPFSNELLLAAIGSAMSRQEARAEEQQEVGNAKAKVAALSPRELQVLQGLLAALPNKLIAHRLSISVRTVELYRANIMDKLGARGLSTAVRLALLAGVEPLIQQ